MGDEVGFLPVDKQKSFPQVDSITWGVHSQHAQSTQNNKFTISLQYLKENLKDEVDFLPADKHQRIFQSDNIILDVCLARHAQVTQNNKFAISQQYPKKK